MVNFSPARGQYDFLDANVNNGMVRASSMGYAVPVGRYRFHASNLSTLGQPWVRQWAFQCQNGRFSPNPKSGRQWRQQVAKQWFPPRRRPKIPFQSESVNNGYSTMVRFLPPVETMVYLIKCQLLHFRFRQWGAWQNPLFMDNGQQWIVPESIVHCHLLTHCRRQ